MRQKCTFASLLVVFLFQAGSFATARLRVDESATTIRFGATGAENQLQLVVENPGSPLHVRLQLEWLDTDDRVRGRIERDERLRAGRNRLVVRFPFDFAALRQDDRREFLWYRVQYRIEPASAEQSFEPVIGVLTVGQISPAAFVLRLAHPAGVAAGTPLRVRVRSLHPLTEKGVAGVQLNGIATYENEDFDAVKVSAGSRTDNDGHAVLEFPLPANFHSEVDIEITGRHGGFEDVAESTAYPAGLPRILLTTDKPIYQPGQTLRVRLLAFDGAERAMSGQVVGVRVEDPEGTLVYRAELTTSRFGVASSEWMVPESLRLGEYSIQASLEDSPFEDEVGARKLVRISRYELPAFTVTVEPNRQFYLRGQDAEVRVRADYLFGKPVTQGRARIVREEGRHWNYRKQKWEFTESEKYEGEAATGEFRVTIPLAQHHDDLSDHQRFDDIEYAAYLTDASTGRTEQRRFALRVTRDPIHIYVIDSNYAAEGVPQRFYVSTSYADGMPASCDVVVQQALPAQTAAGKEDAPVYRDVRKVRTNRYGLVRVDDLLLAWDKEGGNNLLLHARDGKGASGSQSHHIWKSPFPVLRVETNKALYRAGEPIEIRLKSDVANATAFVDVTVDNATVTSRRVRLKNGRAWLSLPWRSEYSGEVTLFTYFLGQNRGYSYERSAAASHTVLFPAPRAVRLDVRWSQPEYQPGEKARADFRVRLPGGRMAPAALGLVVFDKAVEERVRTDTDFGGRAPRFGFCADYESWINEQAVAGMRRADLDALDMTQPLPDGLDLVAEVLLRDAPGWLRFDEGRTSTDASEAYGDLARRRVHHIREALADHYKAMTDFPEDATALRRILNEEHVDFDAALDPWGMAFEPQFRFQREKTVLDLQSRGPDKQLGTDDDFSALSTGWPYFLPIGTRITEAVGDHVRKSGRFVRDFKTLAWLMGARGVDLTTLRDPWGSPYRFEFDVQRERYTITVVSAGPDRKFANRERTWGDDFALWTVATDYFASLREPVEAALATFVARRGRFFESEQEAAQALATAQFGPEKLLDPWGRPYYFELTRMARYSDTASVRSYADVSGRPTVRRTIVPVTQVMNWINLRSMGPDGTRGGDDFDVASFRRLALESGGTFEMRKLATSPLLPGSTGAIVGIITDVSGAVVPETQVTAMTNSRENTLETATNEAGEYLLSNLPPGFYRVEFKAAGFRLSVVADVPVGSSSITRLNATLDIGDVTATVEVQAAVLPLQTTNATIADYKAPMSTRPRPPGPIATPRLREYFPETLYWQPEIITDAQGRARIEFPLADNITTWRISALASTEDGKLGSFEGEIRAFQPFFVEHDPPRALTAGDQIALPVVLRNYHDKAQAVDLEMHSAPWFSLLGEARKHVDVPAGDSAREIFSFRADSPVKQGQQRITAAGRSAGDAVEKAVLVRPDGNEIVITAGQVFGATAQFTLEIPRHAIDGSTEAQLKLYPNLMAHVAESVEGILQRPYGCAEQTISSTYPSLLVVRYAKEGAEAPLVNRARRYLRLGYERLLGYRAEGGGFSYWGKGEADAALTAYALRFLRDASIVISVDEELIRSTGAWLAQQLQADGSWRWHNWHGEEHPRRSLMQTAYIARVLAGVATTANAKSAARSPEMQALDRALDYLAVRVAEMDEPYALASFALAAADAGREHHAAQAVARLRTMARDEGDGSYWVLETNSPFYGWGLAGRVETTALVMQALLRAGTVLDDALVNRGTLFLLRAKDRYGVWHSTQATVQVLDTLRAIISHSQPAAGGEQRAEVLVDGTVAATLALPSPTQLTGPVAIHLGSQLGAGAHRIEIRRPAGSTAASAQLVASYYVPWREVENRSGALRLDVRFDKTDAREGEEVRCKVVAERIGHRGYGMMIAEIGLPPGADVDRASLERAKENSRWSLNHYDVLPDRVVVYLWPRAGGMEFEFVFKPRFGMTAKTAPSQLYDYYNPEARVVLAPALFRVASGTPQLRAAQ
ncbi:MAG: alpha-2-macroglobulin family protein [Candidatus Acidiferrales bacterium]